jgi:polyferredoxin
LLLTAKRRITQAVALVVLNVNLFGVNSQWLCIPALNCHGCGMAWFGCPLGVISHFAEYRVFPFLVLGALLAVGAVVGRLLCGWVCPFGLLQDLLYRIPTPKIELPRLWTLVKYAVLIVSVILLPLLFTTQNAYFFCRMCPQATLQVAVPNMIAAGGMNPESAVLRFSVLAAVLALVIGQHRSFCRGLCPIAALIAVTNKFSLFTVRADGKACTDCGKCDRSCPMGVPIDKLRHADKLVSGHPECIECLACEQVCPAGAISSSPLGRTASRARRAGAGENGGCLLPPGEDGR